MWLALFLESLQWVKEMFVTDNPFLHLHMSKRLLSKFHGPFISTHSIWYVELNLNWKIFFPTSTILRSEPNFQADLRVLFKVLKFWFWSARNLPKRLSANSSKSSDLLVVEMELFSSSSLVSWRCCNPSMTAWSIAVRCRAEIMGYSKPREIPYQRREGRLMLHERKWLLCRERTIVSVAFS